MQCVRVLIYIKTIINKLGQKSRVVRPFRQLWTTAGSGRGYGGHVGGHVRTRVTRVCSRAEVNSASRKTSVDNHTHTHTHIQREREREREREKKEGVLGIQRNAEDTRDRKPAPIFRTCVKRKPNSLAKTTPIFNFDKDRFCSEVYFTRASDIKLEINSCLLPLFTFVKCRKLFTFAPTSVKKK